MRAMEWRSAIPAYPQLFAAAAAARQASHDARVQSVVATWHAAGTRLAVRDTRIRTVWTLYQQMRIADGIHLDG
jgi:hypothetical protein